MYFPPYELFGIWFVVLLIRFPRDWVDVIKVVGGTWVFAAPFCLLTGSSWITGTIILGIVAAIQLVSELNPAKYTGRQSNEHKTEPEENGWYSGSWSGDTPDWIDEPPSNVVLLNTQHQ